MRADVQREDARNVERYHHDLERNGWRETDVRVTEPIVLDNIIKTYIQYSIK